MPKFHVYGKVSGSKYLGVVEAPTAEEAAERAIKTAHVSFCHQCSDDCEDPQVESATAEPAE